MNVPKGLHSKPESLPGQSSREGVLKQRWRVGVQHWLSGLGKLDCEVLLHSGNDLERLEPETVPGHCSVSEDLKAHRIQHLESNTAA